MERVWEKYFLYDMKEELDLGLGLESIFVDQ